MGGLDVANGHALLRVRSSTLVVVGHSLRVQDLLEGVEGLDEAEGRCDRSFPRSR
jgi:hypothetical protein